MNAKEYLNQAFRVNQRINSKFDQIESLRALATKCSAVISDMPRNPNRGGSSLEDTVVRIQEQEEIIKEDINKLLKLKQIIGEMIKGVTNIEYQTLLELRYLSFKTWEEIAVEMGYGIDNIYKMHRSALKSVKLPKTLQ